MSLAVTIIGGGLAGAEAAWLLADRGFAVTLIDQKPAARSSAHRVGDLAELVCSNSLRSCNPMNAVGLLKEELRRLGALSMRVAKSTCVPAGDALAVDRSAFSQGMTAALCGHPRISVQCREVEALPGPEDGEIIVATGPLTSDALAADMATVTGRERLYFYDAIAPIVAADSIDREVAFAASRYDKGDGDDYLNCPFDEREYEVFVQALLTADLFPTHACEEPRYFAGCLPVEVVARSGADALRYGAMKPVGLRDPRTGRRPFAVVQLRREDRAGQAYNLVGFQTKMRQGEQLRVLRMIPGLTNVEVLRFGAIHRNTYLDAPALLDERMRLGARPHLRFAGQVTGVEGYVESAAHGLLTALLLAADRLGTELSPPPKESALGGLYVHVRGQNLLARRAYEPANVNWSMMPPPPAGIKKSATRSLRLLRAVESFERWAFASGLALAPRSEDLARLLPARDGAA